jgi:uncharacterized protein YcnI
MILRSFRSWAAIISVAALFFATLSSSALAHVQVTPERAAPNDSVKFSILVPGERAEKTIRVELKVPRGIVPYSFGDTPGWKRKIIEADDGTVDRIVWSGSMAKDSFVVFDLLAATPEQTGTLSWKAIQTYRDGEAVEWIGAEDSEKPAAFTKISKGVPRQSAGVEKSDDASSVKSKAVKNETTGNTPDPVARALGGAALLLGIISSLILVMKRSEQSDS